MAKCDKCDGNGWKDNPKYWNATRMNDWYLQYNPRIDCRACKGTGYMIGDVRDAIDILRVYKNNPHGITKSEFLKAIEILEKLFNTP